MLLYDTHITHTHNTYTTHTQKKTHKNAHNTHTHTYTETQTPIHTETYADLSITYAHLSIYTHTLRNICTSIYIYCNQNCGEFNLVGWQIDSGQSITTIFGSLAD